MIKQELVNFEKMSDTDLISSAGVFLILLAFFLLSTDRLKPDGKVYNILNIAGAVLLGISAYMLNSIPFVILEAIWALAGVYGLFMSKKGVL